MDNKFFAALIFLVLICASFWVFNHINPWLGWAAFIGTVYLAFSHFSKHSKITKI